MKPFGVLSAAFAISLVAPALFADTTVSYKYDLKPGAGAPARMLGPVLEAAKSKIPTSTVVQIKGKLARATSAPFVTVSDFDKQVITVIDPAHDQFATVYMKDYQDQVLSMLQGSLPTIPADARKFMDSMQSSFSSQNTGKTDTVMGIQVAETELTLAVTMPAKPGAAPSNDVTPAGEPQVVLQMVIHMWTALPSEVERVPALKEFSAVYGDPSANQVIDPTGWMGKIFGSLPGMGTGFASMIEAMQEKKAIILKTQFEMFMPMAQAMLAAQARAKGTDQAETPDTTAPFMEMTTEVDNISAAPIDDSVFAVPRDYRLVSVPELLKSIMPAPPAAEATDSATPSAPVARKAEAAPQN
jgi:hypothetical protein